MDSASQETVVERNQLQLIAQFLEDLSESSESQVEAELCRAVAENYRMAATTADPTRDATRTSIIQLGFASGRAA